MSTSNDDPVPRDSDPFPDLSGLNQPIVRGRGSRRRPSEIVAEHVRLLQAVKKRLESRFKSEAENWVPDTIFINSLTSVADSAARLLRDLRALRREEREAYGTMTEDQLDEVFLATIERVAIRMKPHEVVTILIKALRLPEAEASAIVRQGFEYRLESDRRAHEAGAANLISALPGESYNCAKHRDRIAQILAERRAKK